MSAKPAEKSSVAEKSCSGMPSGRAKSKSSPFKSSILAMRSLELSLFWLRGLLPSSLEFTLAGDFAAFCCEPLGRTKSKSSEPKETEWFNIGSSILSFVILLLVWVEYPPTVLVSSCKLSSEFNLAVKSSFSVSGCSVKIFSSSGGTSKRIWSKLSSYLYAVLRIVPPKAWGILWLSVRFSACLGAVDALSEIIASGCCAAWEICGEDGCCGLLLIASVWFSLFFFFFLLFFLCSSPKVRSSPNECSSPKVRSLLRMGASPKFVTGSKCRGVSSSLRACIPAGISAAAILFSSSQRGFIAELFMFGVSASAVFSFL